MSSNDVKLEGMSEAIGEMVEYLTDAISRAESGKQNEKSEMRAEHLELIMGSLQEAINYIAEALEEW